MSEYEPDECSFESTSEKSCKKLIPHCSPEYLRKLTQEGAELNEKLVGKCVENNFPMREKRLKNDLLNSDDENSTKKIENLENILNIKSEPNAEAIDTDKNQSEDKSVSYHNLLNSEYENSNNTIESFDKSLRVNTEEKDDIIDDKINKRENMFENPKLNTENNDFNRTNENLNDSKKMEEEKNIEVKNKIEKLTSTIAKFKFKNENSENEKENRKKFLSKKTKRNNEIKDDNNIKMTKQKPEDIFAVIYPVYRRDYYIKDFKEFFFNYLKEKANKLINNIELPKNKGKLQIHTPNRILYGGNSNEEDNKKLIDKTVKEVFIDQGNGEDLEGTSRQRDNEIIFNIIDEYQKNLQSKLKKKEIYKKQYEEIEKLNEQDEEIKQLKKKYEEIEKLSKQNEEIKELKKFLDLKIKDALDKYYISDEFGEFRSKAKIRYYDEKFKIERGRNLSLLESKKENEDNNFVKYVNLPFYRKKNGKK